LSTTFTEIMVFDSRIPSNLATVSPAEKGSRRGDSIFWIWQSEEYHFQAFGKGISIPTSDSELPTW